MIRLRVELQEMVYQQRDVLAPFAQFGHANVDYVKAVVEVFSKLPFAHRLDNILIGGRNHSHINLFIFAPADLANHSFLQDAQQLCLKLRLKRLHLIKKEGAAVRRLK